MTDGIVKMKRQIVAIFLVLSWRIVESTSVIESKIVPPESIDIAKEVYNFYKPSGIVIIYDDHEPDLNAKTSLAGTLRKLSRDYIMSQVIAFDQLEIIVNSTRKDEDRDDTRSWMQPPLDPLYMLILREEENVEHFRAVSENVPRGVASWFVYVENEGEPKYFDCTRPRGNPFNLALHSRVVVKCSDDPFLRRHYSVNDSDTMVVNLGRWTPGKALSIRGMVNQYDRKSCVNCQFTLHVARQKPSSLSSDGNQKFILDIVEELRNITVFNFVVKIEEDVLGYRTGSNEWIGLMKIMKEKKVDMAAVLLSMSSTRMFAVDFTVPLILTDCGIYAKLPDSSNIQWSAYIEVLGKRTCLIIGAVFLAMSIVLGLFKNNFKKFTLPARVFFENFINIWGIFTQQGFKETSMTDVIQILYSSMFMSSIILNAMYSGSITSYITALSPTLPFSNYTDFMQDKTYSLVVIRGSRDEDLITSVGDKLLTPLKRRLRNKDLLPLVPYEGYLQACEENVAFYSNEASFDGITETLPCNLGFLRNDRYEFLSLALTKNSPYTGPINHFIIRLMNYGIVNRLKRQYYYKFTEIPENKPNYITVSEIMPILLIWGLGVLASFIILCIEIATRNSEYNCNYHRRDKLKNLKLLKVKSKKVVY